MITPGLLLFALQLGQATIAGTITDKETGAPIPGATVVLSDLQRILVTDGIGRYNAPNVPAGPQHVTVRSIGYQERTLHAFIPRAGTLELNIALNSQPILLQPTEVRARPAIRGLESAEQPATLDRVIGIAAVRNHPLLAEPDVFQALAGGEVLARPESPSGLHVRGSASDHVVYLLDGIPVFSPYHSAGVFSAWNPDAIANLEVTSAAPRPAQPDALSGAIAASTRVPDERLRIQGSVGTAQTRATLSGPLGAAAFILGVRATAPDLLAPDDEPSYLRGHASDVLGKVIVPVAGGTLSVLGYAARNHIDALADASDVAEDAARNRFEWQSISAGGEFTRPAGSVLLRARGWSAQGRADAAWSGALMRSRRDDAGAVISVERQGSSAGLRFEASRTSYGVAGVSIAARTPVWAPFAEHTVQTGSLDISTRVALPYAVGAWHASPRLQVRWRVQPALTVIASASRLQQFAQSLRNPESVAGNIFPADLYLGAGAAVVPIARSSNAILGAEYRPAPGLRFAVQTFAREFAGLLLTAPNSSGPFSEGAFTSGSGSAQGAALDAAFSGSGFGLTFSYGWQRVRLSFLDSTYVPEWGASHNLEAGVIVFPAPTWAVRAGLSGAAGRRSTSLSGALEWESCNLLDQGCEFAGVPSTDPGGLGVTKMPLYARLDVGLRKHWHARMGGRDASIALFGSVSNILGQSNVLTYATDPESGQRASIQMRPRSLLVVGIDWNF